SSKAVGRTEDFWAALRSANLPRFDQTTVRFASSAAAAPFDESFRDSLFRSAEQASSMMDVRRVVSAVGLLDDAVFPDKWEIVNLAASKVRGISRIIGGRTVDLNFRSELIKLLNQGGCRRYLLVLFAAWALNERGGTVDDLPIGLLAVR